MLGIPQELLGATPDVARYITFSIFAVVNIVGNRAKSGPNGEQSASAHDPEVTGVFAGAFSSANCAKCSGFLSDLVRSIQLCSPDPRRCCHVRPVSAGLVAHGAPKVWPNGPRCGGTGGD